MARAADRKVQDDVLRHLEEATALFQPDSLERARPHPGPDTVRDRLHDLFRRK